MVRSLISSMANLIKSVFVGITKIPAFIKQQIAETGSIFANLRRTLNNLAGTNIKLGIYHIKKKNFSDAIFRFRMIDRFFDPGNVEANYWLGLTYFLKGNNQKAATHLAIGKEKDDIGLLSFIKNIDKVSEVPTPVYELHRDIMKEYFVDKFGDKIEDIAKTLIILLNDAIEKLPEHYTILELGSNVGVIGNEINARMQDNYSLTGVEVSGEMIHAKKLCFPDIRNLYNNINHSSVTDFLKSDKNTYNIIVSLDGFAFKSDLKSIFRSISAKLKSGGYFAFCVRSGAATSFVNKYLEFIYNTGEVKASLTAHKFKLLSEYQYSIDKNNQCSIFICQKN